MADIKKSLPNNVTGEFFVDSTCINCDTCRQLAPATFEDDGEYSYVRCQPDSRTETRSALQALLSCPTGSIGTRHSNDAKDAMADFPLHLEEGVHYCGFNSPKSYGGNSYFVQHQGGNWLIDSPKYVKPLIERFEQLGGIKYIFLTHQDDVAEAHNFAKHFGSSRIIHQSEISAQPDAEILIEGNDPVQLFPSFTVIPTPGHTKGHCVLLYRNKYLFTGDHLWWSRHNRRLAASKRVCWHSWPQQTESMSKLQDYDFQWILPGHGQRKKLESGSAKQLLIDLVQWMKED